MSLVLSGLLGANLVQDGVVSESKLSAQALETSSPQRIWCSNPVPTTSGLTALVRIPLTAGRIQL